jgi:hypothetical protein
MINRLWYGIFYINPRPILALGPLVLWLIWAPRVDMTWYEKCHIIIINIFNLVTRIQLLKGNKIYYHMMILCEIVLIVFKYPVDLILHFKTEIPSLFSILSCTTWLLRTYVFFIRIGIMVFNVTSQNNSVISVSFIGGGNYCSFSGNMHWLHIQVVVNPTTMRSRP